MAETLKNSKDLNAGDMISVFVEALNQTEDGFILEVDKNQGMEVYEKIDISSYPSFDDYKGESIIVQTGDIGTIFKFIGRPYRITGDGVWSNYDVYEVLIHGKIKQMFRRNLLTLEELKEIKS